MEIIGLNEDFLPVCDLPCINVQWNRKYYECGDFSVQLNVEYWNNDIRYIYRADRPETGIVQQFSYSNSQGKRYIQISGFFLEALLGDKVVYPTYYASGNRELTIRDMVSTYKADIPLLQMGSVAGIGSNATWQETGGSLDKVCYTNLQTEEMSYRLNLDYVNNRILFQVYRGLDRTYTTGQTDNNPVVFTRSLSDISSIEYTTDSSDYKNCAIVAGQGEGSARIFVIVDQSGAERRKEIFCDMKNEAQEGSDEEYKAALTQIGKEKLLDHQTISNMEIDVTQENQLYMEDYDLGDKVEGIVPELQKSIVGRITEVREVYKESNKEISIVIGDKIYTQYDKLKARL